MYNAIDNIACLKNKKKMLNMLLLYKYVILLYMYVSAFY